MEDDFIVTLEDYKAVRKGRNGDYCMPGLERWAKTNKLSYRNLLRHGIKASALRGIKDPYVAKVLAAAEKRIAEEKANAIS